MTGQRTSRARSLTSQLGALESADLIRVAQKKPELEYLFRHALVQEAAYNSLLKQQRRGLHRAIGETLERVYADRLDEYVAVLGHHFHEADDHARALRYFVRAGDLAAARYANAEAILHYTQALEIARSDTADPSEWFAGGSRALVAHLYTKRGRAFELSVRYDEAVANYIEMLALARERGERALELAALMARATVHATRNPAFNPPQASALCAEALALARDLHDRAAETRVLWTLMVMSAFTSRAAEALRYGEQAEALARELELTEVLAFVLHDLFLTYLANDRVAQAVAVEAEARAMWRRLGNLPMLAESIGRASIGALIRGQFAQCIAYSDESYRLSEQIQNVEGQVNSRAVVGIAYMERGEVSSAINVMRVALGARAQNALGLTFLGAELALLYGMLGAADEGFPRAHRARAIAEERLPPIRPLAVAALIQLHVQQGDVAAAQQWAAQIDSYQAVKQRLPFLTTVWARTAESLMRLALAARDFERGLMLADDFLAVLRQIEGHMFMPNALYVKGRMLWESGRAAEAAETLQAARYEAESLGAQFRLWPILMALRVIALQHGDVPEAESLVAQARTIVAFIADHCPPELRASFLNLPDVMHVNSEQ